MNKRIQKLICFIPYVSTFIILFATMLNLKRKKAPFRYWMCFHLIFALMGCALCTINAIFVKIDAPILDRIVSIVVLTVANFSFIQLQCCAPAHAEDKKHTMGFVNQKLVIIIALICAVLSVVVVSICFTKDASEYIDTNGEDDTSLACITLDEILSTSGNYSATRVQHSCEGEPTLVPKSLNSSDYDTIVFRCKLVNGIKTLQTTKVTQNTVTLIVDSKIKSGNMEIIILVDNEYFCHVATDCQQIVELNNIAGKTIIVRMAAESAEIDISVSRQFDQAA